MNSQLSLMDHPGAIALVGASCHWPGCRATVVGSSTQSIGFVCRPHNEYEWGTALVRSGRWPEMGQRLIAASGVRP